MWHWDNAMRGLALLLALILLAFLCFSGVYCMAQAHHSCAGEHCPICGQIGRLLTLVAEFGMTTVSLGCVWMIRIPFTTQQNPAAFIRIQPTPIARFDKMNN